MSARRFYLSGFVSCFALLALGAGAAPVLATPPPPKYSLSIAEGESTLPEDSIASTEGSVQPHASVAVSIIRGGVTVARATGADGGAWMSQVPQPGDVVTLESPIKTPIGAQIYDGLPSIDPTVCVGSASFSGQNSPSETVKGGYFTETPNLPYGPERTSFGRAQVTALSGTSYGGSFLAPLLLGQTVYAVESLESPLPGGAVFTYTSENDRPVGACPVPPPPPPPPPPPALQGSIFKLVRTTLHKFLHSGWSDQVTINQPGTVFQDLYLQNGKFPAFASSRGKHHARKLPPAQLVGRGSTTSARAGTVKVLIRVTRKGRHLLSHRSKVSLVLITTLRSATGKLTLAHRTITLHR